MKGLTRRVLLFGVLAATIAAAIWPNGSDDQIATPVSRLPHKFPAAPFSAPHSVATVASPSATLQTRLERDKEMAVDHNPFAVHSWAVAPPVQPAPVTAEPSAATAPPLPFSYAGKLETDPGHWVFYLMRGEQSFAVKPGDVFDGVYRFDGPDNDSLLIQYLPLSTPQRLRLHPES